MNLYPYLKEELKLFTKVNREFTDHPSNSQDEGKYRNNLQTGIFSDIAGPKAKNTVLFFKNKKPRSRISTPRQSHVHSGYVFDTREPRILGSVGKTSPSLTLLVPFRPMFGRTDSRHVMPDTGTGGAGSPTTMVASNPRSLE